MLVLNGEVDELLWTTVAFCCEELDLQRQGAVSIYGKFNRSSHRCHSHLADSATDPLGLCLALVMRNSTQHRPSDVHQDGRMRKRQKGSSQARRDALPSTGDRTLLDCPHDRAGDLSLDRLPSPRKR